MVTYDIDGNAEAVIGGESGFVIPTFDKDRLAESIATLMHDPELRRRMGETGRTFARERFDTRTMVDKLDAVYAEASADQHRPVVRKQK